MICYTEEVLKHKLMEIKGLKSYRKRFCYTELERYIFEAYDYRVMSIYGLKDTGKATMMYQMIQQLDDYAHVCLIQCQSGESMYDLTAMLDAHQNCKYFFIEEVTKLDNFITNSAVLSDIYATFGAKVILSGTNSLGFYIAKGDQLFDRTYILHTTYISYKEYNYLLGCSLDNYIMYGGTLADNKTNPVSNLYSGYTESAIIKNLIFNLSHIKGAYEYGQLILDFQNDAIEDLLRKILDVYNHIFLAKIINKRFVASNMDFSGYLSQESPRAIEEARQWLNIMDVIYRIPSTIDKEHPECEEAIFLQSGLRYWQLEAMVKELKSSNTLPASNEQEDVAYQLIMNDIKERLLEDITYYQKINDENIDADV